MPAGDRTGPQGMGPRTGRGLGYCSGYAAPGYTKPGFGGAWGRGFGRGGGWGGGWGRGWRHRYYATGMPGWARADYDYYYGAPQAPAPPAPEQELAYLQDQADYLKDQLDQIQQRISELEEKE